MKPNRWYRYIEESNKFKRIHYFYCEREDAKMGTSFFNGKSFVFVVYNDGTFKFNVDNDYRIFNYELDCFQLCNKPLKGFNSIIKDIKNNLFNGI